MQGVRGDPREKPPQRWPTPFHRRRDSSSLRRHQVHLCARAHIGIPSKRPRDPQRVTVAPLPPSNPRDGLLFRVSTKKTCPRATAAAKEHTPPSNSHPKEPLACHPPRTPPFPRELCSPRLRTGAGTPARVSRRRVGWSGSPGFGGISGRFEFGMPVDLRRHTHRVEIGEGTQVREGARDERGYRIGTRVSIDRDVRTGDHCTIQNGADIHGGVTVEDGVFVGPGAQSTKDPYPPDHRADGRPLGDGDQEPVPTVVRHEASLGAGRHDPLRDRDRRARHGRRRSAQHAQRAPPRPRGGTPGPRDRDGVRLREARGEPGVSRGWMRALPPAEGAVAYARCPPPGAPAVSPASARPTCRCTRARPCVAGAGSRRRPRGTRARTGARHPPSRPGRGLPPVRATPWPLRCRASRTWNTRPSRSLPRSSSAEIPAHRRPRALHLAKMGLIWLSAHFTASSGLILSVAARANIWGMMKVSNTSETAPLANPGCPTLVLHLGASTSTAYLWGFPSRWAAASVRRACFTFSGGTVPMRDGNSYSSLA